MKSAAAACRVLFVAFLFLQEAGADTPVSPVKLELETRIVQGEILEGALSLRPISTPGDPISVPVQNGAREVTLSLPAHSVWEVEPQIRRYWAARTRIEVKGPDEVTGYVLGLWPKGTVAGSVAVEQGERLPDRISVKLRAARLPGRKPDVPDLTVECPLGKHGEWTCDVPATLVDLTIRAEGFVPHNRWAVHLERDKAFSLGRLALKKGASVSGWAQVEEGSLDSQARARLTPLQTPGPDSSLAERLRSAALEAPLDERGFFQFAGVPSGSYAVEVTQSGFAPTRVSPIEVWPASETALTQPLTLRRPLRIELSIAPERDWLDKPWQVTVLRVPDLGGSAASVHEGPARADGRLVLEGQAPGTFRVLVSDSLDNPLYSDVDFLIRDSTDAQRAIEIELVTLRGELLLGEEPLSATLYFGGRHASLGSRMESDEDGEFHGVLPRDGNWLVEIDSTEPALSTHAKVEVKAREDGTARVSIQVPDTRVFGKVIGEEGGPAKARVFADTGHGSVDIGSREDGSFEIRGLPSGPVRLSARADSRGGSLVSDATLTVLGEDHQVGPVELRLRKNKLLQGRVQSARGPVQGAVLEIFPLRPALPGGASVRTDLQGSFEARVPESTEMVLAIASPPGNGLKAFEVPLDGKPALLEVSREAGTLVISAGLSEEEAREHDLQMVVAQNGLRLPWDLLLHWAQGHGERLRISDGLRIPNLAPAEYRVCLVRRAELVQRGPEELGAPGGPCASGYLEAGATLRLNLRSSTHPAGGTVIPEGGRPIPSGRTAIPNGGTLIPEGGTTIPSGEVTIPNGETVIPEGGTAIPEGETTIPAGEAAIP